MSAKTELRIDLRGLDKTAAAFRSVIGRVGKLGAATAGIFTGVGLVAGKELIGTLSGIEKSAAKIGISTDSYQALDDVFESLGMGAGDMEKTFLGLQKSLGSEKKAKIFQSLGLDIETLRAMRPDELFKTVGAAIAGLPTESERAAAAMGTIGKAGTALLPVFRQGPEAFTSGLTAIADMLPDFSAQSVSAAYSIQEGFKAVGQTLTVDVVNAFMGAANNGGIAFENLGAGILKTYYKIKLFAKNVFALFGWLKDSVMAMFDADLLKNMPTLEERFTKNIEENMKESAAAVDNFIKGSAAKKTFRTPLSGIEDAADRVKIKLDEVKQAVSQFGAMATSGSYAAIQSQYGGMMPAVGGRGRINDPFSKANGGQALLEKLYEQMKKVAKNTEETADNTDFEEV